MNNMIKVEVRNDIEIVAWNWEKFIIPKWEDSLSIWFDEFGNQLIETNSWNVHQITEEMATSLYEALDVTESDVFLESIEARLAII